MTPRRRRPARNIAEAIDHLMPLDDPEPADRTAQPGQDAAHRRALNHDAAPDREPLPYRIDRR